MRLRLAMSRFGSNSIRILSHRYQLSKESNRCRFDLSRFEFSSNRIRKQYELQLRLITTIMFCLFIVVRKHDNINYDICQCSFIKPFFSSQTLHYRVISFIRALISFMMILFLSFNASFLCTRLFDEYEVYDK